MEVRGVLLLHRLDARAAGGESDVGSRQQRLCHARLRSFYPEPIGLTNERAEFLLEWSKGDSRLDAADHVEPV